MSRPLRSRVTLVWKIITPTLVIVAILGPVAGFVLARDRAARADAATSRELASLAVSARARLHERALYVREAVNQAANLQGMASAVERGDARQVGALLDSVRAVKTDLDALAVVGAGGFDPLGAGALLASAPAIVDSELILTAPVCRPDPVCVEVGTAVGAVRIDSPLAAAGGGRASVEATAAVPSGDDGLVRYSRDGRGRAVATMRAPFDLDGQRLGTITVTLPREGTSGSSVVLLASLLFGGMVVAVGLALVIARSVLAQVRELHATSTALGSGDLSRRAPVITDDEIGDLARVLNQMAGELEASHATLESRVEERTAEVRALLQARTDFFTALSHELRTPLAIILSQARLQRDPDYRGRRSTPATAWTVVEDSAQQLLQEVNAILELARVSAGRLQPELATIDVGAVIDAVAARFASVAATCGVRLEVDVPETTPAVTADPAMLRDVITNVVDNAVKYTPTGGSVVMRAETYNGSVRIEVADTGVGIPEDARPNVFKPFFRAPGVATQHGEPSTGLGLAVAKQLAELQRGELTLSGNEPEGTTVTVTLPRA